MGLYSFSRSREADKGKNKGKKTGQNEITPGGGTKEICGFMKGSFIRVIPMKRTVDNTLIYLYRPEHLKKDLDDPQALKILKNRGYSVESPECCVVQLAQHLNK